jgi:hypothetical protein
MNDKWKQLIEECEENGYNPREVQRIIMYYEMTTGLDEKLKKLYEDEKNKVIIQIHYLSNDNKSHRAGSFPLRDKKPEQVAIEFWK